MTRRDQTLRAWIERDSPHQPWKSCVSYAGRVHQKSTGSRIRKAAGSSFTITGGTTRTVSTRTLSTYLTLGEHPASSTATAVASKISFTSSVATFSSLLLLCELL